MVSGACSSTTLVGPEPINCILFLLSIRFSSAYHIYSTYRVRSRNVRYLVEAMTKFHRMEKNELLLYTPY